jgi:CDP-diacylglycerol pyrophosphatase
MWSRRRRQARRPRRVSVGFERLAAKRPPSTLYGKAVKVLRYLALVLGLAIAAAAWLAPPLADASNPDALWHVVHDLCVTDMRVSHLPAPCLEVNRRGGYAALKDLKGKTQILLIPTARVTGIESPKLLAEDSPNYWQAAWQARRFFEQRAGGAVPRDDIGLAINSINGRSQNQLHIHVDCVRSDVKAALEDHAGDIGAHWRPLEVDLAGERYRAMRLYGDDLSGEDPFKLLADESAKVREDMGLQTLAVIGWDFHGRPGFILLAATGGVPGNPQGASEDLLDHTCQVLSEASPNMSGPIRH